MACGLKMGDQPARLREARTEIEMFAGEGAAEAASDVERIAGLAAGAQDAVGAFDPAGERDAEKERAGRTRGFAADEGDSKLAGGLLQTGVERLDAVDGRGGRRGEGDEGVRRAHRPWRRCR
jgi:hypothetical protein